MIWNTSLWYVLSHLVGTGGADGSQDARWPVTFRDALRAESPKVIVDDESGESTLDDIH